MAPKLIVWLSAWLLSGAIAIYLLAKWDHVRKMPLNKLLIAVSVTLVIGAAGFIAATVATITDMRNKAAAQA